MVKTKRINILHVVRPAEGGIRRHVCNLLTHLDRSRFNLEIAFLVPPGMGEDFRLPFLRQHPLPMWGNFSYSDWVAASFLRRLIRQEPVHLVHSHGARAALITMLATITPSAKPVTVTSAHNFIYYPGAPWLQYFYARIFGCLVRGTDHFLAVSSAIARHLTDDDRVSAGRITVIPNGIDLSRFHGRDESAPGYPTVGVIARLIPAKGVHLFLEAAACIRREIPESRFIIVGDGPERKKLEEQSALLGLKSCTVFSGWRNDVADLLPSLSVLVIPSLTEGFSITALEAMAASRPVVAFAVGGLPEVVQHNETGVLVPPGNTRLLAGAVLKLLRDPFSAEGMGRKGRIIAEERFEISAQVKKIQSLYENLLAKNKR